MRIHLASLAFGSSLRSGGGNPVWSTDLGEVKPDLKIIYPGCEEVLKGMDYRSIPTYAVSCNMNKGGTLHLGSESPAIRKAARFTEVFINGKNIGYPFILLLTSDQSDSWYGRLALKYSIRAVAYGSVVNGKVEYVAATKQRYDNNTDVLSSNEEFFKRAFATLGLGPNACWFVHDISVVNQNELHMTAVIVDSQNEQSYANAQARNSDWSARILPPKPFKEQDFLADIKSSQCGLCYEDSLLKRFVSALMAKPFVVLTGLSGSGKTKLAQAFTKWIAAENTVKVIPVGADWTNSEKLLGYPNALDKTEYVMPDTGVLKLMMDAEKNSKLPFFLILDEMNLSHVERYFADFLSAMESGDEIKLYDGDQRYGNKEKTIAIPRRIRVPKNLFVIGTMNVDETTYMFSPKVLDRAQVIEFRVKHNEMADFVGHWEDANHNICESTAAGATWVAGKATQIDLSKLADANGVGKGAKYAESFLEQALKRGEKKPSDQPVPAAPAGHPANPDTGRIPLQEIAKTLNAFFKELAALGAEFGYRSASEILSFCGYYLDTGAKIDEAIDAAIVQKLLPKVHGSRRKLVEYLKAMWKLCLKDGKTSTLETLFAPNSTLTVEGEAKYPLSAEKISRMYKAAIENGFASFAEA